MAPGRSEPQPSALRTPRSDSLSDRGIPDAIDGFEAPVSPPKYGPCIWPGEVTWALSYLNKDQFGGIIPDGHRLAIRVRLSLLAPAIIQAPRGIAEC